MRAKPRGGLSAMGPRAGTLLSAGLLAVHFLPLDVQALVWVGFVPWLFEVAKSASARAAMLQGLWLGGLFSSVAGYGLAPATAAYLEQPLAVGLAVMLGHAFLCQLHMVLFAPIFRLLAVRSAAPAPASHAAVSLLVGALLYTGFEWATPKLLNDTFGLALYAYPALRQLAEVGGVRLLTFLVLVVNLALFSVLRAARSPATSWRERAGRAVPAAATAAALLAVSAVFGAARLELWEERIAAAERTVRVGLVQGNAPRELRLRWASGDIAAARESLAIYQRETDGLLRGVAPPDFVLWPETAYPGIFRKPETRGQLELNLTFDRYVAARGLPFVFGAYDVETRGNERVLLNGLFFVEPGIDQDARTLSPMQVHHKSRLFPVGEYVPFVDRRTAREWLPGAGALAAAGAPGTYVLGVGPGREPLRLGPAICYEDVFTSHPSALARLGAELFVNVSNDAWFRDSGVSRFHFVLARMRSVELRLPQVRATNTGYSAVVLPTGKLLAESGFGETWARSVDVPITAVEPTLVARFGDWFGPASLLVGVAGLVALWWAPSRVGHSASPPMPPSR